MNWEKPFLKKTVQKNLKNQQKMENWLKQENMSRMNYEWIGKTIQKKNKSKKSKKCGTKTK